MSCHPEQCRRDRKQASGTPIRVRDHADKFGRRDRNPIADKEGLTCCFRGGHAPGQEISEVLHADQAPAIRNARQRQWNSRAHKHHQPSKVAADTGPMDKRRANHHHLQAGLDGNFTKGDLSLPFGYSVRIHRMGRVDLSEWPRPTGLAHHLDAAHIDQSPDSGRGSRSRKSGSGITVDAAERTESVCRRLAHDVDPCGDMDHGGDIAQHWPPFDRVPEVTDGDDSGRSGHVLSGTPDGSSDIVSARSKNGHDRPSN